MHDDPIREEIIARQPLPRRRGSWLRENWFSVLTLLGVLLLQLRSGSEWAWTRQEAERSIAGDVLALKLQLQAIPATYVRQDVQTERWNAMMDRLASVERKLDTVISRQGVR